MVGIKERGERKNGKKEEDGKEVVERWKKGKREVGGQRQREKKERKRVDSKSQRNDSLFRFVKWVY